jgi:hypothetical protein
LSLQQAIQQLSLKALLSALVCQLPAVGKPLTLNLILYVFVPEKTKKHFPPFGVVF